MLRSTRKAGYGTEAGEKVNMEFLTGKDYPLLCSGCRSMIDQCVELVIIIGEGTDDNEAPLMLAGDNNLLCGGRECVCECAEDEFDVLCPAHGGTEEQKSAVLKKWCQENGHSFPRNREAPCAWGCGSVGIQEEVIHVAM